MTTLDHTSWTPASKGTDAIGSISDGPQLKQITLTEKSQWMKCLTLRKKQRNSIRNRKRKETFQKPAH